MDVLRITCDSAWEVPVPSKAISCSRYNAQLSQVEAAGATSDATPVLSGLRGGGGSLGRRQGNLLPTVPQKGGHAGQAAGPHLCSLPGRSSLPHSLLPRGGRGAPTWLLKGQAPVARVLLQLNLLQGEDGGSWEERGERKGESWAGAGARGTPGQGTPAVSTGPGAPRLRSLSLT